MRIIQKVIIKGFQMKNNSQANGLIATSKKFKNSFPQLKESTVRAF